MLPTQKDQLFLILVIIQGFHSIEEYIGHLWKVFPPATYLCSLVSNNLEKGFLIINIGLFVIGMLCWCFLVRKNHKWAIIPIWFWIVIEIINGIGHPVWTLMEGGYTPGVITAPFLFVFALLLFRKSL